MTLLGRERHDHHSSSFIIIDINIKHHNHLHLCLHLHHYHQRLFGTTFFDFLCHPDLSSSFLLIDHFVFFRAIRAYVSDRERNDDGYVPSFRYEFDHSNSHDLSFISCSHCFLHTESHRPSIQPPIICSRENYYPSTIHSLRSHSLFLSFLPSILPLFLPVPNYVVLFVFIISPS